MTRAAFPVRRAARVTACVATLAMLAALAAAPLAARDHLGIYSGWAAFRDADEPRCYAIAKPTPSRLQRDHDPYVAIGTWPKTEVRGQVHFLLSRDPAKGERILLSIGARSFTLAGNGARAWARDAQMDARIVAAMRSASKMVIRARDTRGRRFANTYSLAGAATAMDAATLGCAQD